MKILKKLHFFLFVACFFGIGQAFAAWDGTSKTQPVKEGDYYIINTEAELAWYAANYSNWNARLNANLDLGGISGSRLRRDRVMPDTLKFSMVMAM